jgi:peptidoglycan/xylan/chitin deacetylase (PgdA/CDA1 family)
LLKLFERMGIKTTWFIPGHSIETFPSQMKAVADAGHEIGIHGYTHENPIAMTPAQEEAVLDKCIGLVEQLCGKRPTGYVAPWWEFSQCDQRAAGEKRHQVRPLADAQRLHALLRAGGRPVDTHRLRQAAQKSGWCPCSAAPKPALIEIPANWYLDDLPPMMFIKKSPNSHGFVNPRDIEQMWRDQFDWVYREMDYAVFPDNHPP